MQVIVILTTLSQASATVTVFENKAAWEAAAGPHAAITFTELPENTWITEQYAPMGVHFTDGSDQILHNTNGFGDGYGLNGAFDETTLEFDSAMNTISADFPGLLNYKLYWQGQLFYTGTIFGGSGSGHFAGLISTQPFDEVFLYDPGGGLFVDNLYFGAPVPGPAALGLLAAAAVTKSRRRR